MLFFKPKRKEIIPPPSPDFEEELKERPKFFDELIKKPKPEIFTEEDEFNRLVKELNEGLKPLAGKANAIAKKEGLTKPAGKISSRKPKNSVFSSKQKILIKNAKRQKKLQPKRLMRIKATKEKAMQLKKIKTAKRITKKEPKAGLSDMKDDFEFSDIGFGLPERIEDDIQLPERLEDFEIGDFDVGNELKQKTKPQEILEAEEEIKSAIEKIKKRESPSILHRLFLKKRKEEAQEEPLLLESQDNLSRIQNKISEARWALTRFDLETARRNYIEAMRLYNNMPPEERAKVYRDIKELYFERKSAEELRV